MRVLSDGKIFQNLRSKVPRNAPTPTIKAKQYLFALKPPKENPYNSEVEDPVACLRVSTIQPANQPVDPATEQNKFGLSGQDIDEFRIRLIGSFKPGLLIQPRMSCEPDNPHADNNFNYNRIVRKRQ